MMEPLTGTSPRQLARMAGVLYLLNQFTPLVLLGRAQERGTDRLQDLAYAPLGLVSIGYDIQQVIYAFYLLAAGYLVFRSTFVPRVIGVLLAIGAVAYLVYSFAS